MERHIVAYGGGGGTEELTRRLFGFAFDLAGKERPRVGFVPTAVGDAAESIVSFYERYAELGDAIVEALERYAEEVRSGAFPDERHTYAMPEEEQAAFEAAPNPK